MIPKQRDVGDAVLTYDVCEPGSASAHRPLMLIAQPMTAEGLATLASHFTERVALAVRLREVLDR